jgi:glutamine transport system substrate-binding protein
MSWWRPTGLCSLAVVLLSGMATSQTGNLAAIKARGKLVAVCFPQQDSPFVKVNLAAGPMRRIGSAADFEGIDIDILSAFAKSIGVTLEIHTISEPDFAQLIPALQRGEGDVIIGGFTITPEREREVSFSSPYYSVLRTVITRKESSIATLNELASKTAVVVSGSSQLDSIRTLKIPKLHLRLADFTRDCLLAVRDHNADFTVVDSVQAAVLLGDYPELKIAFSYGSPQRYGYAVLKGNDLKDALSTFLTTTLSADAVGEIFARHMPS